MFSKLKILCNGAQIKKFRIAVIPGDGIGKEVIPWGQKCLEAIHLYSPSKFECITLDAGYECFTKTGTSIPETTLTEMKKCEGALFGAAATPAIAPYGYVSPIIDFRRRFDLYANLRPMKSAPVDTPSARSNVDMEVVRENTECLYVRREKYELLQADKVAVAERQVSEVASLRICKLAFERARKRAKRRMYGSPHVTMVHKANIMPLSEGVFREAFLKVASEHPDVSYDEHLLDSFMYKVTMHPHDFDVVVAPNTWGNIISNAFAPLVGGLGMVEGLNVGDNFVVGEPVHGAPKDLENLGIANPIASMRAAVAISDHLMKDSYLMSILNQAIEAVLMEGKCLTRDLGGAPTTKGSELGELVLRKFSQLLDHHYSKQSPQA